MKSADSHLSVRRKKKNPQSLSKLLWGSCEVIIESAAQHKRGVGAPRRPPSPVAAAVAALRDAAGGGARNPLRLRLRRASSAPRSTILQFRRAGRRLPRLPADELGPRGLLDGWGGGLV
jgi:hypothetical protein